jgi:intermediate peptidase
MRGVVEGVSRLAERVFGVTLTLTSMLPGEAWCDDARKVSVNDASTGEPLGVVYLDVAPRPGKFPHAAHFVVRCSRSVSKKKMNTLVGPLGDGEDGAERTLPSVALVCNFGSPGGSFDKTHLTHSEVETFMHELGHAMHSVLSRTEYQHLSGTRCAADLVEVPSHVFEYFAWDPDAVKLLSKHRVTGDPMPNELLQNLKINKDLFAATDLRQQLVFASVDLETHAMGDDDGEIKITHESIRDIAARLSEEGFFPNGAGSGAEKKNANAELDCAWELRFGHVVGYASTYYSYVYARLIAASIWEKHFANGALEPGAGRRLTECLFKFGGAVAPETLVRDLLGPTSLVDVGGGIAPDNAAALRELESGERGFF